ncbi:hypothetical protein K490DRAFT_66524 [Saccharata proteae CBS 121410]|uniref:BTB domain-containing protein n=1 Tax=Saccharata proteae CBS 121410 TaxID=1314787 RepID=A0A9P4HUK7_9PEZI|nr:hypothetical protein K490DRAFT_66524 [Saccharata proteae CBS 121410]
MGDSLPSEEALSAFSDVAFILRDGTRLRLNITPLLEASPVFRTMFGPRFKEGRQLRDDITAPLDIPMPDESPSTVQLCVRLLEDQYFLRTLSSDTRLGLDKRSPGQAIKTNPRVGPLSLTGQVTVSEGMELWTLKSAARFVDKYDMSAAPIFIRFSTDWLNALLDQIIYQNDKDPKQDYVMLLETAYLFNNAPAFQAISKAIILHTEGALPPCSYMSRSLERTYNAITAQRSAIKNGLIAGLAGIPIWEDNEQRIKRPRSDTDLEECRLRLDFLYYMAIANDAKKGDLLPADTSDMSLKDIERYAEEKLLKPEPWYGSLCVGCTRELLSIASWIKTWVRVEARRLTIVKGVCVDCMRAGPEGRNTSTCRIPANQHF